MLSVGLRFSAGSMTPISPLHPVKVNPSAGEAVTETLVFSL